MVVDVDIISNPSPAPSPPSFKSPRAKLGAPGHYYPYGRRDSASRTRFLLVRTSNLQGKETFKRVTLPGGGNLSFLHLTIERALQMGRVTHVYTLPEHRLVERDEQIAQLEDCQKVEVLYDDGAGARNTKERKGSLPNVAQSIKAGRITRAFSVDEECLQETGMGEEKVPEIRNRRGSAVIRAIRYIENKDTDASFTTDTPTSELSTPSEIDEEIVTQHFVYDFKNTVEKQKPIDDQNVSTTVSFGAALRRYYDAGVQRLEHPRAIATIVYVMLGVLGISGIAAVFGYSFKPK